MNYFNSKDAPPLDELAEKRAGQKLRRALADHASSVEPSSNSYMELSQRIDNHGQGSVTPTGWRSGRFLAAAAMIVLIAGVGTFILSQVPQQTLEATGDSGPSQFLPDSAASTTAPVITTAPTESPELTPTTAVPVDHEPVTVRIESPAMPASSGAAEAAERLTLLLGLPGRAEFGESDGAGTVAQPGASDSGNAAFATVRVVPVPNGVVAAEATSETVRIDDVQTIDGEIVVTGQARAFEATVDISLVSTDGTVLLRSFAQTAECCEQLEPFEARLPIPAGQGEGFIVASADGAGSGVVPPFAAVPIQYRGAADTLTYTVFRVLPEDQDQGLNMRDLPGTDEGTVVETLPSGTQGIRLLPEMPALVGDSFWWAVAAPSGRTGWVNSWFLTPEGSTLTDAELVERAGSFIYSIAAADSAYEVLPIDNLSARVPVALGWIGDPQTFSGPELNDSALWLEARQWSVPEATFGESEKLISLRSLFNLPDISSQFDIEPGAQLPYGFELNMAQSFFSGTQAVTIIGPEVDGGQWRSTVLFFESSPTGPVLVGAVSSIFVP